MSLSDSRGERAALRDANGRQSTGNSSQILAKFTLNSWTGLSWTDSLSQTKFGECSKWNFSVLYSVNANNMLIRIECSQRKAALGAFHLQAMC